MEQVNKSYLSFSALNISQLKNFVFSVASFYIKSFKQSATKFFYFTAENFFNFFTLIDVRARSTPSTSIAQITMNTYSIYLWNGAGS